MAANNDVPGRVSRKGDIIGARSLERRGGCGRISRGGKIALLMCQRL